MLCGVAKKYQKKVKTLKLCRGFLLNQNRKKQWWVPFHCNNRRKLIYRLDFREKIQFKLKFIILINNFLKIGPETSRLFPGATAAFLTLFVYSANNLVQVCTDHKVIIYIQRVTGRLRETNLRQFNTADQLGALLLCPCLFRPSDNMWCSRRADAPQCMHFPTDFTPS